MASQETNANCTDEPEVVRFFHLTGFRMLWAAPGLEPNTASSDCWIGTLS
jgi:hypothetical protein